MSGDLSQKRLGSQVSMTQSLGSRSRSVLISSAGPKYILRSWPDGYKMFVHYKGPQDNPRTDKYLFGVSPFTVTFLLAGSHHFDCRFDVRQALSLRPRIRASRGMAHDG